MFCHSGKSAPVPDEQPEANREKFRDSYNKIANSAQLRDIKLVSASFDILPSFFTSYDDVNLHLDSSVESVQFSAEGSFVVGAFVYDVRAVLKRKRVLRCKGHFIVVYDVPEDATEEAATAFCNRVGFFAAYPYFRALFSTVTRFGGAELPLLPVVSSSSLERASQLGEKKKPQKKAKNKVQARR